MICGINGNEVAHCSGSCSSCGDSKGFGKPLNRVIQLKLAPLKDPRYNNADLLIAADCTCFVCPQFHRDYINGRVVIILCPEQDGESITEKLAEIFRENDFRSLTMTRMQETCCEQTEAAVKSAIRLSGRIMPFRTVTFGPDGEEI